MKRSLTIILTLLALLFFVSPTVTFAACSTNFDCNRDSTIDGCQIDSTGRPYCSATAIDQVVSAGQSAVNTAGAAANAAVNNIGNNSSKSPLTNCGGQAVDSALGCIPITAEGFTEQILVLAIGLGGGIALLLMLYGFFQLATSSGIPDKVKAGQEIITSAVGGLLFIIFSVILMQLIGVNIIGIPGL